MVVALAVEVHLVVGVVSGSWNLDVSLLFSLSGERLLLLPLVVLELVVLCMFLGVDERMQRCWLNYL